MMRDRVKFHLLQHLRPWHLLAALALYLVGVGLARYLGAKLDGSKLLLGMLWQVCALEGFFFLGDYLQRPFQDPLFPLNRFKDLDEKREDRSSDEVLLYSALSFLTGAAVVTFLMIVGKNADPEVYGLMAGYFGILAVLVLPGLALDSTGIDIFATSLILVVFSPALGFFTQYGDFHRYLSLAVFPLFPLHLALMLSLRLRSYPADLRHSRKTLLVRIGWVKAVFLHNLLVLSGFLLFGAALLFGLPLRIAGPVLLSLLPAAYLIWYYANLEKGAPVRWKIILSLALVVFFLPVYFMLFAVWIY